MSAPGIDSPSFGITALSKGLHVGRTLLAPPVELVDVAAAAFALVCSGVGPAGADAPIVDTSCCVRESVWNCLELFTPVNIWRV